MDGLKEQRRRVARAFADGAFTDDEYGARIADLDAQIVGAGAETVPDLELIAALCRDVRRLWAKATPEERQKLVEPLIDTVTIDLAAKAIGEIRAAPAVASLLGTVAA